MRRDFSSQELDKSNFRAGFYGEQITSKKPLKQMNSRQTRQIRAVKAFFWFCSAIFVICVMTMIFGYDYKISQKNVIQTLDLRNKINICSEEENDRIELKFW